MAAPCVLTTALTLRDAGIAALVLERDTQPAGSTVLSSGFIPACRTRWQAERGIEDDVELMAGDIQTQARQLADSAIVYLCCWRSAPTLEWLAATHGIPFNLIEDYRQAEAAGTVKTAESEAALAPHLGLSEAVPSRTLA